MIGLVGENNDVYTEWQLKTKLQIKYGEHIMFIEASGKPKIKTELIVNDKWFSTEKKTQMTRVRKSL